MNPTPTNLFSTSTSTQSRLPNNFSHFRNQFSQSAQSCSDSDLESTRKDSQNSQDSTQFTQNLPSQVQMYYPNSYPSNKEAKQDLGLFSDENPLPIAYGSSRKKIQSLTEIEAKEDLAIRMVNRQREILLNNRASTSTALQPIAEKAETPRNDGSDITESSSPQSTRQDLQYFQDNDLLRKYDESERESQGKLSNTATPLSARSMFPTSFFGSSNPLVPLQNFNSSSCINLSSGFARADGNKPNLPPLSVPTAMNGVNKAGAASRDLFSEFNNEKSDEDTSPSGFKMMQNKFLPKRTVSDNNIPTLFNKKDEPAKSAQKNSQSFCQQDV